MTSIAHALKTFNTQDRQFNHTFLQGILEGFMDGILILTEQGEILHANRQLIQIIESLAQNEFEAHHLNQEIWRLHEATIDLSDLQNHRSIIIESELLTSSLGRLQLQSRHFQLTMFPTPVVLVTIQDQQLQKRVFLSDVQHHGLTSREVEIWALRQAKHSYAEIATELFISINTVKKHLKNVYAKLGCSSHRRMKAS